MGYSLWGCTELDLTEGNVYIEILTPTEMVLCIYTHIHIRASLIDPLVNHLPTMQESQVRFLGQEDPLEKEMATHSSILAWRIPWTEEPGGL